MGEEEELLQEPEIILQNPLESPPEEFSAVDPPDFSVLRLHSSPPSSSSSAAENRRWRLENLHRSPCSSCGCSGHSHTRKRPAAPAHPNPAKKLFLDAPTPPETHRCEPLRRAVSGSAVPPNASSPAQPAGLPPLPPPLLRRCTSVPVPVPAPTPPPSAPKSFSRTSSSSVQDFDDSPISKRSKMLSSWREFNQWIEGEFMAVEQQQQQQEEDLRAKQSPSLVTVPSSTTTTERDNNDDDGDDIDNQEDNGNCFVNSNKADLAAEFEESLSVERDGERMNVHFKCHCGNGYQFLLVDGNCFYKLI